MKLFDNIDLEKLKKGLTKTRTKLFNSVTEVFTGKIKIDDETLEKLEEILISADIGYELVEKIVENVRVKLKSEKDRSNISIINTIKDELTQIFVTEKSNEEKIDKKPYVILIVGVNGVGKTTTIGKLAYNFKRSGAKVIVGAADTFRAAASEQLNIWAERASADLIHKQSGADPSSVAFDTIKKAIDEKYDVAMIDTAGRLHSKTNLMSELDKIKRAINKVLPGAPHDTYLILDATVGQNALIQAKEFIKVTDITGLVITKLDGTAKGGSVFQICNAQKIPIKYIGVGERIDDLQKFDSTSFVEAIFGNEKIK
ncbi:MAG: signal recognition particle-docking protein FtsY [Ignavibacteriaceae bacterium]|nr:signal recognition particle-docking protein FtsY [Ignavibacteria bacterium]MBT8392626.1 signal recognition particle-docking protein FtsY [Ignavibacteria bacterium]NNJ53084.1 signal recognition particle-docking protein FtsY [Ignavibacteriaceae bacterium]NNL20289.1 signal recognition particle-docking protein FtsY [Ignavibacteriaceae bacterium]